MKLIWQIELTNHCNRRCHYCGQANMTRDKGFMTEEILRAALDVTQSFGHKTIMLHHYGESLMHPRYLESIQIANDYGLAVEIYTNGDLLTDSILGRLSQLKIYRMIISGHGNMQARMALANHVRTFGIEVNYQVDIAANASNIAGQIPIKTWDAELPPLTDPATQCSFLRDDVGIVLWNGDVVPCCYDYDGLSIYGHITDPDIKTKTARPRRICATCPGHMVDQPAGRVWK